MTRAIALVDGEHYPPVTRQAITELEERGYQVVAAVMLGGHEKLSGPLDLGPTPVLAGETMIGALRSALRRYEPAVVLDLSDAPVLDSAKRFLLIGEALAAGAAYHGADFRFEPPHRPRVTAIPTVAVIGTGKRTGKTAVAAAFARDIAATGASVVIVAMGRGGPATPVVTRGDIERPTVADLVALAERGEHAASDSYEDAVVAGVTTVGARRAGAGFSGAPFSHTVHEAIRAAEAIGPDLIVLEGSGTAIPPAAADATILVAGGATPALEVGWGLGPYRLLLADLVCVTMAEEPVLSSETLSVLHSTFRALARDVPIVKTVFRPAPVGSVSGKKVLFATTAPPSVGPALVEHLEAEHGATVIGVTHWLSTRSRLADDLARAEGTYEVLLTEVKAAAIDVAARAALAAGAEVVFADNIPVPTDGDLGGAFTSVAATARARAAARA